MKKTLIVVVITCEEDMRAALEDPDIAKAYELRLDCAKSKKIISGIRRLKRLGKVIILTVRDPAEGGKKKSWNIKKRLALFRKYLHLASFIDIEAVNAYRSREIIALAKICGIGVIISYHALEPVSFKIMRSGIAWAVMMFEAFRADILKMAVAVEDAQEMRLFSRHAFLLMEGFPGRVAPMAIGQKYGLSSRRNYVRRGAALVYCSLARAVIPGQWQAAVFKRKFARFVAL